MYTSAFHCGLAANANPPPIMTVSSQAMAEPFFAHAYKFVLGCQEIGWQQWQPPSDDCGCPHGVRLMCLFCFSIIFMCPCKMIYCEYIMSCYCEYIMFWEVVETDPYMPAVAAAGLDEVSSSVPFSA